MMKDSEITQIYDDLKAFMKELKKSYPDLYEQLEPILERLGAALDGVLDDELKRLYMPWN